MSWLVTELHLLLRETMLTHYNDALDLFCADSSGWDFWQLSERTSPLRRINVAIHVHFGSSVDEVSQLQEQHRLGYQDRWWWRQDS